MSLITTINLALQALIALANAYTKRLDGEGEREIERLEDEIDTLAANGSPASKLRIERLAARLKCKRIARSRDNPPA